MALFNQAARRLRMGNSQCAAGRARQPRVVRARVTTRAQAAATATTVDALFTPIKVGGMQLKHRIVLPPLTRCRAPNNVPVQEMVTYYEQRTTDGGLLIAEATCISPEAQGYPNTPGIWNEEQVAAWKPVVDAVHAKGGAFYSQLWHVGRASHPDYQPGGALPVAPSAIRICDDWDLYTPKGGPFKYPTPRALEASEIPGIVAAYVQAAKNAIAAGFDGIEVHSANGYLLCEFLSTGTNVRTDAYGGSVEKRARFTLEVVDACIEAIGASRVAVRLSPFNAFLDCVDANPLETYTYVMQQLDKRGLAYVSLVEPRVKFGIRDLEGELDESLQPFRDAYSGVLLVAGGHSGESGASVIESGAADLVGYGRHFIANPDLPLRIRLGAPLNPYDRNTFYGANPIELGYIDYPALSDGEVASLSRSS